MPALAVARKHTVHCGVLSPRCALRALLAGRHGATSRLGFLVGACNQLLALRLDDLPSHRTSRASSIFAQGVSPEASQGQQLFTLEEAAGAFAQQERTLSCLLSLINTVISSPQSLKLRIKLRSEFIRLKVLDAIAAVGTITHVDVVEQVQIFERQMSQDNMEVGKLTRAQEGSSLRPLAGRDFNHLDEGSARWPDPLLENASIPRDNDATESREGSLRDDADDPWPRTVATTRNGSGKRRVILTACNHTYCPLSRACQSSIRHS